MNNEPYSLEQARRLSADEAALLREQYEFKLFVGAHFGVVSRDTPAANRPTQQEYRQIEQLIADMKPGDILCAEGYGLDPNAPMLTADVIDTLEKRDTDVRARIAAGLDTLRGNYCISLWDYAWHLAALKGAKTVLADHNSHEAEALSEHVGKPLPALLASADSEDQKAAAIVQSQRETRAYNTVIDNVLACSSGTQLQDKRYAVLMYGASHRDGIRALFEESSLPVNVLQMDYSSMESRIIEHAYFDAFVRGTDPF